ncbi:MAG: hypothetical protein ACHP7N_00365 [Caulobacterales bacterium]
MKRWNWLILSMCGAWVLALAIVASSPFGGPLPLLKAPATAAWMLAIGTIGAILGGFAVMREQLAKTGEREEAKEARALRRRRISAWHLCGLVERRFTATLKSMRAAAVLNSNDLDLFARAFDTDARALQDLEIHSLEDLAMMNDFQSAKGLAWSAADTIRACQKVGWAPGGRDDTLQALAINLGKLQATLGRVAESVRRRVEILAGPFTPDELPRDVTTGAPSGSAQG